MAFLLDNWILVALTAVTGGALLWSVAREYGGGLPRLSPAQAVQLINRRNAVVVDVRDAEAFGKGHIAGAVHLPESALAEASVRLQRVAKRPLVVVCASGSSAAAAARKIAAAGAFELHLLAGGMTAWGEAKLPVSR